MRAILACLLLPLTAQAGTIPLASFTWRQPEPVTLPATYGATIKMYGSDAFGVGFNETVEAFPHHSFADQTTVDAWNAELSTAAEFVEFNGEIRFFHGSQTYFPCGWCQFHWSIGGGKDQFLIEKAAAGFAAEMLAPSLGPMLTSYFLTGIERTVTAESQTITLHGMTIPEPAPWLLAWVAFVLAIVANVRIKRIEKRLTDLQ